MLKAVFPNLDKLTSKAPIAIGALLKITPDKAFEALDPWLAVFHLPSVSTLVAHNVGWLLIAGGTIWTFWPSPSLLASLKNWWLAIGKTRASFVPNIPHSMFYYVESTRQTQIALRGHITNASDGPVRFLRCQVVGGGQSVEAVVLFSERSGGVFNSEVWIDPGATAAINVDAFVSGLLPERPRLRFKLTDQLAREHVFPIEPLRWPAGRPGHS
jgi:hypothetical protein